MEESHNSHPLLLGFKVKLLIVTFSAFVSMGSFYLPAQAEAASGSNNEAPISLAKGLIMLDYESIPLPQGKSIDLHGVNYLHQLNDWLYLGVGLYAPLFEGDYGGFLAVGAAAHVQKKIYHDLFFDAGLSFGGGGGGSSIQQVRDLSGQGGFIKKYVGLGYNLDGYKVGMNYAHFEFLKSQINHAQLNVFFQRPVSYSMGLYANTNKEVDVAYLFPEGRGSKFSFELNNIFQIHPTGSKKKTINSVSIQLSHDLSERYYGFFAVEVGYQGVTLYNHILEGLGYKWLISNSLMGYIQIGVGSGGYSKVQIDTGAGLLVYPKLSMEYMLSDSLGLSISSGYLFAPKGTSKNYTLGASLNYTISKDTKEFYAEALQFVGQRYSFFEQTDTNVTVGGKNHRNLHFFSMQFDYILNDNWYLPAQVGLAYTPLLGYPGNGELLFGLGLQSKYNADSLFQNFIQILAGPYGHGIMLKPSIGTFYSLSDSYAIYAQYSKVIPLSDYSPKGNGRSLPIKADAFGIGVSYRFSLPKLFTN
jgi:hypothetical protein